MGQPTEKAQEPTANEAIAAEIRGRLAREIRRSAELDVQLAQARVDLAAARSELESLRHETATLARELDAVRHQNDLIRSSRTWRYAQALRGVRGGSQ